MAGPSTETTPERPALPGVAAGLDDRHRRPLDDEDRARRRGIVIGPQGVDGMSKLSGWVTPQWRATVEAIC
ncbi:13E12 repeat family protein, partial [Mycolicibacterium insubricum]|uniref:13E12 repeat family protein n=1 Tax=Mycolicibacterium insubricum TaxID=444597 RepID=UPI0021F3215D